jgi:hypothetical protein
MHFEDERLRSMNEHWPPRRRRKQTHPVILLSVALFTSYTLWLSHFSLNLSAAEPPQQAETLPAAPVEVVRKPDAMQSAPSVAQPIRPPYSESSNCYRAYDRADRGDTFVRCGTAAASSCCRSFGGTACYYQVEAERCDHPAVAGSLDTAVGTEGVNSDGDGDLEADDEEEDVAESTATTEVFPVAAASEPEPPPLRGPLPEDVAAHAIVPMIVVESGSRVRGRIAAYPRFNLTWTRGAPAPGHRAAGWSPTEAQRRALPARDLKESFYRSCAVVGSSGNLRRSGYGWFIDRHELVMRFNGAPAGSAFTADVGARTTLVLLADVASTECVDGQARAPYAAAAAAPAVGASHLLPELAVSWRPIKGCNYYPEAEPPPRLLFLPKRGGVERLVEYALAHPEQQVSIRSDQFADEVDAQIDAYKADTSHPTSGFNGINLALHLCETLDIYGFGTQREKYFSPPRPEKEGSQHLYRSEYRWLLGLEKRFPGRVRVWP